MDNALACVAMTLGIHDSERIAQPLLCPVDISGNVCRLGALPQLCNSCRSAVLSIFPEGGY